MSSHQKKNFFEKFSNWATVATGSSAAFISATVVIIVWIVTGPVFHYSDTWQLVINTGTTIITFLMVFLIQKSQNKDSKAIHLKLNELLASHQGASNRMVNIEDLTEKELDQLHKFYIKLSKLAEQEDDITCTHSIDAAEENHETKQTGFRSKTHYQNALKNRSKKSK
ncbi:low affinity iron permease family protein [Mucilaginibacter pallidiroseus]|uniref:Low affinity iron permease family protein n=1 Tax=Mucilaginibacter pallidiroseus TaxID=2599295 RepID=A0A563UDR3_9SPHI|nr:low affinity iron permease family protein [Mucilaginibacter pallidiroseus]TWR29474.1 low affinity iron permease family protein [Mucilaginibacter pallidiroseus]